MSVFSCNFAVRFRNKFRQLIIKIDYAMEEIKKYEDSLFERVAALIEQARKL